MMKRILISAMGIALFFVCAFVKPAVAHPPRHMTLTFDSNTQTLHVEAQHTTSNITKHYIRTLHIYKNDEETGHYTYPTQTKPTMLVKDIPMQAKPGDTIRVRAICNEGGDIEETLTISEPTSNDQGQSSQDHTK